MPRITYRLVALAMQKSVKIGPSGQMKYYRSYFTLALRSLGVSEGQVLLGCLYNLKIHWHAFKVLLYVRYLLGGSARGWLQIVIFFSVRKKQVTKGGRSA